jgi:transcription termination/antitermination factor nusG
MSENANAAKWYVVHTYSGYENKVKTNLEKIIENRGISHLITDVRIPVELTSETNAEGVTKESESKIFPSYVFVKMVMTDETWHIVMTITGATGFVGPGSRPVPLTDKEVEALGVDSAAKTATTSFKVGDSVSIKSGPMSGFVGTISEISPDLKKVTVTASVFGRQTPVELDISSIAAEK